MAVVVSTDDLTELLSPLGFALAAAREAALARAAEYLTFMEVMQQADVQLYA